jgi:hypothetical protein
MPQVLHIRANNRPTYEVLLRGKGPRVIIQILGLNPSPEYQHHHHPSIESTDSEYLVVSLIFLDQR